MHTSVRPELPADAAAVRAVNEAAFGSSVEADIVEAVRDRDRAAISLVAERNGRIVGHILFSAVSLGGHAERCLMGLGPMAVLPGQQRQGTGSALVRAGLARCAELGCDAVVVLGHPAYYPRFGFVPASRYALACEYDVPDEAFMVVELRPGGLRDASGTIRYDAAFDSA